LNVALFKLLKLMTADPVTPVESIEPLVLYCMSALAEAVEPLARMHARVRILVENPLHLRTIRIVFLLKVNGAILEVPSILKGEGERPGRYSNLAERVNLDFGKQSHFFSSLSDRLPTRSEACWAATPPRRRSARNATGPRDATGAHGVSPSRSVHARSERSRDPVHTPAGADDRAHLHAARPAYSGLRHTDWLDLAGWPGGTAADARLRPCRA
jgi:hypothetical protein